MTFDAATIDNWRRYWQLTPLLLTIDAATQLSPLLDTMTPPLYATIDAGTFLQFTPLFVTIDAAICHNWRRYLSQWRRCLSHWRYCIHQLTPLLGTIEAAVRHNWRHTCWDLTPLYFISCVPQYRGISSCCASDYKCDSERDALGQCTVDGVTYKHGEKMYPKKVRKTAKKCFYLVWPSWAGFVQISNTTYSFDSWRSKNKWTLLIYISFYNPTVFWCTFTVDNCMELWNRNGRE